MVLFRVSSRKANCCCWRMRCNLSCFLTERKSNALVKAIGKLGSKYLADDLRRNLHVEGRIRSQNESVFYNIDAIQLSYFRQEKYVPVTSNTTIGRDESLQRDGRF